MSKCDEVVTKSLVSDPLKSEALVGWLNGELKPPG
jgi:hypothetical protein